MTNGLVIRRITIQKELLSDTGAKGGFKPYNVIKVRKTFVVDAIRYHCEWRHGAKAAIRPNQTFSHSQVVNAAKGYGQKSTRHRLFPTPQSQLWIRFDFQRLDQT